jgi:hypothetical protein
VTLLRRSYTILKRIHADKILDGITLPRHWHDVPTAMLASYHNDHPVIPGSPEIVGSVHKFLDFAIQVSVRLCEVHTKKVRHGALRPENLTVSPDGKVWLHDFTCASLLFNGERSSETRAEPEYLPYLAPESTGRINRRVDYRSDFYSLGATLFHILTGHRLWASLNPILDELDVANKHVTQPPPSTNFHPAVDAVIAKLLAKMPEHRYQTCEGLLSDWKDIQNNPDAPFIVGKADQASRFMIPQGVYGRDAEKQQLYTLFEQARDQRCLQVVFLKGYAGVGKSSLVKEAVGLMQQSPQTIFCSGKFDQNKSVPFSAIVQALEDLTKQVLTETASDLAQWRAAVHDVLNGESAVLLPLIPDVAHILGVDSPDIVPDLEDPISQEERQKRVLTQFFRVFAQRKTIVMFMDDLQWSSRSDLQLLTGLVQDFASAANIPSTDSASMFLICAYRDNVVGDSHSVRTIFENKVISQSIEVLPLSQSDTERLVSDTLHRSLDECQPLSKLIYGRSRGNPFFIERVQFRSKGVTDIRC